MCRIRYRVPRLKKVVSCPRPSKLTLGAHTKTNTNIPLYSVGISLVCRFLTLASMGEDCVYRRVCIDTVLCL